jgi:hypothetical protein
MSIVVPIRRTTRHRVHARGQAVDPARFSLVGERFLDVSAEGCLLACDDGVAVGQTLLLSFALPSTGLWFDAEAEVVRVIEGWRDGDPGYAAGLRFTDFDRRDRLELGVDLRALPSTVGTRIPRDRLFALGC